MPNIRLREFVLLNCNFELWPDRGEGPSEEPASAHIEPADRPYPEEQLVVLSVTTLSEVGEATLFVEVDLDDPRLPFRLYFEAGASFSVSDAADTPHDELEPFLVWVTFPYVQEFVANLTGRAPISQYHPPPLTRPPTRMPHPDDTDAS